MPPVSVQIQARLDMFPFPVPNVVQRCSGTASECSCHRAIPASLFRLSKNVGDRVGLLVLLVYQPASAAIGCVALNPSFRSFTPSTLLYSHVCCVGCCLLVQLQVAVVYLFRFKSSTAKPYGGSYAPQRLPSRRTNPQLSRLRMLR